jgi:peptidyl-prolyl cis-trans isomerase SurA
MDTKNKIDSVYLMIERGDISFDEAVKKYSTDKAASNGGVIVNPYTMDNKFPASHLDASVLFTIEKLEPGQISNVVSFKNDENNSGYRIIFVIKKTPPHTANLQDDYPLIHEFALNQKKQEALNAWIMEKKSYTFIKVSEQYDNCSFKFDW